MYEMPFSADLEVAELSTANLNAIFELGVRHALKPQATIVMAESRFIIPFDANGSESVLRSTHDARRFCVGSWMARHGASKPDMIRPRAAAGQFPRLESTMAGTRVLAVAC